MVMISLIGIGIAFLFVGLGFFIGMKWGYPNLSKWNTADKIGLSFIGIGTLIWASSLVGLTIEAFRAIFG
jgi:hypothetical protein